MFSATGMVEPVIRPETLESYGPWILVMKNNGWTGGRAIGVRKLVMHEGDPLMDQASASLPDPIQCPVIQNTRVERPPLAKRSHEPKRNPMPAYPPIALQSILQWDMIMNSPNPAWPNPLQCQLVSHTAVSDVTNLVDVPLTIRPQDFRLS
ncbi:hypothetical protein Ancab_011504 [Ancistrocladus abbreviatus]